MLRISISLVLVACCVAPTIAENRQPQPGLAVGDKAPDFALVSQLEGKTKLSTLLEKGSVAVVFHRSAQW